MSNIKVTIKISLSILLILFTAYNLMHITNNNEIYYENDTENSVYNTVNYDKEKYFDIATALLYDNYLIDGLGYTNENGLSIYNIDSVYELSKAEKNVISRTISLIDMSVENEHEAEKDIVDPNEPTEVFNGTLEDLENAASGKTSSEVDSSENDAITTESNRDIAYKVKEVYYLKNSIIIKFCKDNIEKYLMLYNIGMKNFDVKYSA